MPAQDRLGVRQALQALLERLPPDVLAALCVRPVQRHIDSCVSAGLGATRVQVGGAARMVMVCRRGDRCMCKRCSGGEELEESDGACVSARGRLPDAPAIHVPRFHPAQVLMAGVLLDIVRQAAAASGGRIPYTGAWPWLPVGHVQVGGCLIVPQADFCRPSCSQTA